MPRWILALAFIASAHGAQAQGQDSLRSERDLAVIATMLPGIYDNSNQTYFEQRTGVEKTQRHASMHIEIDQHPESAHSFQIRVSSPGTQSPTDVSRYDAALRVDTDNDRVRLTLTAADQWECHYTWHREPQQFSAEADPACPDDAPARMVLSEQQLWWGAANNTDLAPYKLHRARLFECYVDMPGVGGGRNEAYKRFDNITLHDRGDSYWFTSNETPARKLGIALWQVDWPINNYKGAFTRDSLVLSVNEKTAEGSVELGYAFIEPDAERIGLNLKWLLATCFMESNSVTRPSM